MLEDILLYILECEFISSSLETLAFSKTLQPREKGEWELFRVWHIPGGWEMFNEWGHGQMDKNRVVMAKDPWTLRLFSVFAEQESIFYFALVCFSKSKINVIFRKTDPPLILIITRETPWASQTTTEWHFILQNIQGRALERVYN